MRYMEDPAQKKLIDFYKGILSPSGFERLQNGWEHLFQKAILRLMPVKELGKHFDPVIGRPTKELYSMAGLILIMEFEDWTHDDAAEAYMFNVATQYALNLLPENQSMCRRTIARYLTLFRNDELAQQVMSTVTGELVKLLELDVSKQRLDSTHIESNMAKFGRTRLMGIAIKNFLTQVKRHDERSYGRIRKVVRERYEPDRNRLFGDWSQKEDWSKLRQTVAEDMHYLVERYAKNRQHRDRSTYKMLVKVFEQQCEVVVEKEIVHVQVRSATGGDIIVNPSDPDATLDGHKGPGYQVQLAETCSEENEVQLITYAEPQTAVTSDSHAIDGVIERLEDSDLKPKEMTCDTAYGSDRNSQKCAQRGIELLSPAPGRDKDTVLDENKISVGEFEIEFQDRKNQYGQIESVPVCTKCPAGVVPNRSFYDRYTDKIEILQMPEVCRKCSLVEGCPRRLACGWSIVTIDMKDVRLERRRAYQKTDEFRKRYRRRSGIEATNSILKRVTGIGRLRVRGSPSVYTSIILKVAGWNILRAASVRNLLDRKQNFAQGG